MIRCFGENGIRPDVILCGEKDSYILLSKYINNSYVVPDAVLAISLLKEKYTQALSGVYFLLVYGERWMGFS